MRFTCVQKTSHFIQHRICISLLLQHFIIILLVLRVEVVSHASVGAVTPLRGRNVGDEDSRCGMAIPQCVPSGSCRGVARARVGFCDFSLEALLRVCVSFIGPAVCCTIITLGLRDSRAVLGRLQAVAPFRYCTCDMQLQIAEDDCDGQVSLML